MAVAAIDPQFASMMPMAERHGLLARHVLFRIPGRKHDRIERVTQGANDHYGTKDCDLRDHVRTAMKYLWHRYSGECSPYYLWCFSSFVSCTSDRTSTIEIMGKKR